MEIGVYLSFDGRCREAFEAYAAIFGGRIEVIMTVGESPQAPESPRERLGDVMHARLRLGDRLVMGADAPPELRAAAAGYSMSANVADAAEGRRVFDALARDAEVTTPFGPTFWSAGFGMLVDRFGVPWMVNVDAPPE